MASSKMADTSKRKPTKHNVKQRDSHVTTEEEKPFETKEAKAPFAKWRSNGVVAYQNGDLEAAEDGTSTEDEVEDDDAMLLTKNVEHKIFDTLIRIKQKDPIIYSKGHIIFNDEDFEETTSDNMEPLIENRTEKSITYKDLVRETLLLNGAEANAEEEERVALGDTKKAQTYSEEQQSLKADFLNAINFDFEDGDDFLQKKVKSESEVNAEDKEYRKFLSNYSSNVSGNTEEMIRQYWGDDDELDEKQKFLRDYILFEKWKRNGDVSVDATTIDELDEEHLEKVDKFESLHNFRFEEAGGTHLSSYARKTEGSLRRKDERRKRKRMNRKEAKIKMKEQKFDEIRRLKGLKKREMLEKLNRIQEISGAKELPLELFHFDEPFDTEKHDAAIESVYGKDYNEAEEQFTKHELFANFGDLDVFDITESTKLPLMSKRQKRLAKILKKKSTSIDDGMPYAPLPEHSEAFGTNKDDEVNTVEHEGATVFDTDAEASLLQNEEIKDDNHLWFMCDNCQFGIPAGQKRYDCTVCEDFVLCKSCYSSVRHEHALRRKRVPDECKPPNRFLASNKTNNFIEEFLNEYQQLNYEDIIGGDLPTRFKYEKVTPENYGMTIDDILNRDDAELNAVVSRKKLATYRPPEKFKKKRTRPNGFYKGQGKTVSKESYNKQFRADASTSKTQKGNAGKGFSAKSSDLEKLQWKNTGISASRLESYGLLNDSKTSRSA